MLFKRFLLGAVCTAVSAQALVVNLDIEDLSRSTYSGQGVYPDSGNEYWNSSADGMTDLTASDGATATTLDVALSAAGRFEYTQSHALMADYAYALNAAISVEITGLASNAVYDLYIYCQGDQVSQAAAVSFGGITNSTTGDISGSLVEGGNYLVFSNVTSDAVGQISGTVAQNGSKYVALNGLQISGDDFPGPKTFVHPGIGMTVSDLDHIKANLDQEPWKTGYEDLADTSTASLDYTMRGPTNVVGHTSAQGRDDWRSDMIAVHDLARMWYFTEEEAYAQKARDILISWATTHTNFLSGETYLDMGYHAHDVFGGAEILRGTWPGWTQADTDTCKTYFEKVWWDETHIAVPNPLRSANQGMSQLAAALGTAVFLDDEEKLEQCLEAFRTDAAAALLSSLPNGQIGDTGRDSHDQGQLMLAAWCAEVFWNQGIDVYSEYDNRLLAAGEYIARFNLLADTPFVQAGTVYDIYPEMHYLDSAAYPNCSFETKMINLLYSAYVVRKGMSAPYLEKYLSYAPQDEGSFCHLMASDSSTAAPPDALSATAADTASVTSLNQTNMGDCSGGSAAYNADSKTWTVTGRGTALWYSSEPDYHFAYLPVTGDAAIVAQLTSFSGGGDLSARAGLVFTESLDNGDTMGAVAITAPDDDDDLDCFYRGFEASSHMDDSHGKPNQAQPRIPYWLKIERIGSRVNFFSSPDGASWSCAGSADYDLDDTAYFGLAVSADNNNNLASAVFTDVRITGGDGGEASEVPEAPFAIYASPGGGQVPLRWLESFEADSYKIWRSTQSGGPYTLITQETGTSYIDTNVVSGTHYYYKVSAVNAMGESPLSGEEQFHFPNNDYIEGEDYDAKSGVGTEECSDYYGGTNLSSISSGAWVRYDDITLGTGAVFQARMAVYKEDHGQVEVRLGSSDGTLIGTLDPGYTDGTQNYGTFETNLADSAGTYDLYLVFTGGVSNGPSFNLNWFNIVYPHITAYDLGRDTALTFDSDLHELTNLGGITNWDSTSTHLKLADGSDLSNVDFASLGVSSWTTTNFSDASETTIWDGASLNGITLISNGGFGAGDRFAGADFSGLVWGTALSAADSNLFFSGGSGAAAAADKDNALNLSAADLSLITGDARSVMIHNLGGFDGTTAIGAKFDPEFISNSGWDQGAMIDAGWQYTNLNVDAFSTIEGEVYDDQYGVSTQDCSEGGLNVQAIQNGDWCAYYKVDFSSGADGFQARVASDTSGGSIEIRLDSPTGTLVGTCAVAGTGNWQSWETVSTTVSGADGIHDVYLVFTGGSGYLFNLNWFTFIDATPPEMPAGLSADAGDGSVSLDWDANKESDFADYTVYRSVSSGSGYSSIAADLSSSAYVDESAVNGTTYYYVVTASDSRGNESEASTEVSAVPAAMEAAVFLADELSVSNGSFSAQFSGAVGRHYRLEYTADLTTNTWQTVTDIVSLSESPMGVSAQATNDAGFYRIIGVE